MKKVALNRKDKTVSEKKPRTSIRSCISIKLLIEVRGTCSYRRQKKKHTFLYVNNLFCKPRYFLTRKGARSRHFKCTCNTINSLNPSTVIPRLSTPRTVGNLGSSLMMKKKLETSFGIYLRKNIHFIAARSNCRLDCEQTHAGAQAGAASAQSSGEAANLFTRLLPVACARDSKVSPLAG